MYQYTWNEFGRDFKKIVDKIKKSRRKFNGIYCASPGGLPFAICLHRYLDLPLHESPPIERDGNGDLIYDPHLIVVDDVANTGLTLGEFHRAGFFIVTLFKNPNGYVHPEICLREKDTRYILFPWQAAKEPVKSR